MYVSVVLTVACIIQFTCPLHANAQYYSSRSDGIINSSFYSVKTYSKSISELQQIISINMQDTPAGVILNQIADKAELGIAYNADLDFLDDRIDIEMGHITVGSALEAVLQNTNYEPAISKMREIIFIKREPLKPVILPVARVQDISGEVRDAETGETLPGVNVFVKDSNIGVTTDSEGRFSLTVPDEEGQILVFSFVGFRRLELPIGNRTQFNVELEVDVAALDDVIVVGYGTQQRQDVTGAVASVGSDKLQNLPVTSFESAIQGQIAGVTVTETTGEPGATPQVQVRGTGSISAGNDPLYVIDGLPISKNVELQGDLFRRRGAFSPPKANPLATLNPNDIASIEVLKDASAAAIYGSRGSNGVVMITTNKGNRGLVKPQITVSAYGGVQNATNVPDLMNSEELIQYTMDSRNNNYLQTYDPTNPASENFNPDYDPNTNAGRPEDDANVLIPERYVNFDGTDTDWLDLVLSPAELSSYNLSVGGGYENLSYYISGGYYTQNGIIDGSGFDRYTIKANIAGDLSEKFAVGLNLNAALAQHDRLPASAPYFARPPGIVYSALVHSPVVQPFNEDGTPNQLDNQSYLGGGTTTASNPLAIMQAIQEDIDNNRLFGNAYVEYNVLDNLSFKTQLGTDIDNYQRSFFRGNSLLYRNATEGESYGQSSSALSFNWVWENTLSYQKTVAENHRLDAVVGYTAQKQQDERNSIIAQNFPDDQVRTVNGGVITGGEAIEEEWSLVSALARLNYSYREKYLLTGTIRADRSSRFGADNQTGVFPSVSVGWRLTNEPFLNSDLFTELKLRASYGETGNFLIPNYGAIGLLGQSNYIFGDQIDNGVSPITIGNDELSWETTRAFDVGLDYALLNDRIYGSVDYYLSRTEDLLLNVTVPSSSGFQTALTNIGQVENRGFEFSITSRNTVTGFQWATDLNFSTNRNEVLRLGPEGDPILSVGAAGLRHITQIGSETGSYFGYIVDGVYQNQAEIDSAPEDMLAPDPRPGDFRFRDVNGDGIINENDRTVTGSYQPDYTFGITNRFNWKGFDLSVFIQGVEGREVLNLTARHLRNGEANFNSYAVLNDRWISPDNRGDGENPRADRQSDLHGNNNRPSSYQVEDASYIRIKNLTFGYQLPVEWVGKFAKRARIYGTATNLAIFTDYIGFNPEVNLQASSSLTPGEDYGAYPLARTITFGIDMSF